MAYNLADINKALRGKVEEEALGGPMPSQYEGIFKKAYGRLQQPQDIYFSNAPTKTFTEQGLQDFLKDLGKRYGEKKGWPEDVKDYINPGQIPLKDQPTATREALGRGNVVISGTQELAESFIDRFYQNTGQLPSAQQVSEFVGNALTPDWAKSYIEGTAPREANMALAGNFIQDKGLTGTPVPTQIGQAANTVEALQDKLYDRYLGMAGDYTKRQFAPLRTRAIEEEAALGRLRSPVSAASSSPIQQIDQSQANALSDTIQGLLKNRAEGTTDLFKFGESLSAAERRAQEAKSEFGQTFGLEREKFSRMADQQDEASRIAREIGRLQAQGRKPGTLDYLNTAFGGLGSFATLISAFNQPKIQYGTAT